MISCRIAALQRLHPEIGTTALALLQSPQPPPIESVLTLLLNEIAACCDDAWPSGHLSAGRLPPLRFPQRSSRHMGRARQALRWSWMIIMLSTPPPSTRG